MNFNDIKKSTTIDLSSIKNIYCVGRNYALHAKELNNPIPTKPMIFSKPTHAAVSITESNGQELKAVYFPGNKGEIHYELELVISLSQTYQPGMKITQLIDKFTLGIDFTMRDVQSKLKEKQHPWLLAKGFKNSAWFASAIDLKSLATKPETALQILESTDFMLKKNGELVQSGKPEQMIFSMQELVDYIGCNFGLAAGDWIFTGTPAGVGAVAHGDKLEMIWGNTTLGAGLINLR